MDEYGAITSLCVPLIIKAHEIAPSKTDIKLVYLAYGYKTKSSII